MPFTEDLSPFFDADEFATAAVWSVGALSVDGIFDDEYADPLGLIEATAPVFRCAMADMPTVAHGQTLTINAVAYKIFKVLENYGGPGVMLLQLEEP